MSSDVEAITILIADDHAVVREGLRAMFEREGMRVIGEARTGEEAIAMCAQIMPRVVLMDIRMPGLDGLQALAAIKAAHPRVSVIMLTSHASAAHLARAVALGAAGFLSKEVEPDSIVAAVRAIASGEHAIDPVLLQRALAATGTATFEARGAAEDAAEALTDAELRVLRLIAQGLDNDTIARALSLSVNTVKTHVRHIFAKLRVSDRVQAALWAVQHGLGDSPHPMG
ncbi:MAG: response regulator transcription factor [Anaerolineae bacterium]|jgi:DNA-binding NarL/FixJ family response regulator|nr:response regulator transcription factor [Anaerolineae bacterium]